MVYLTFILQTNYLNRNLEEVIRVPTYCQIVENVDETNGEPNIVDYDCIGDLKENYNLSEYKLNKIEESIRKMGLVHLFLQTEKNVPAYRFYQKNGYTELDEHVSFVKRI